MKSAVFHGPGDVRVEERPTPEIEPDEVLIGVRWSSLCGTDNHIFHGNFPVNAPLIIGHDFSGVIEEIGEGVTGFAVGDRVTAEPVQPCGDCEVCRSGAYNVCPTRSIMGMHIDGSLTEKVAVPAKHVFAVPDEVSFEAAALLEGVAVALHALDFADPSPGEQVVVLGQGAIGLLHTQVARATGLEVIASEIDPLRQEFSQRFGARVIDPTKADLETEIVRITDGGAPIVIDTTGAPAGVEIAPRLARNLGRIMIVGSSSELMKHGPAAELVLSKELTVKGVAGGPDKYPIALEMAAAGDLDLEALITHRFQLDQIEEALRLPGKDPGLIKSMVASV